MDATWRWGPNSSLDPRFGSLAGLVDNCCCTSSAVVAAVVVVAVAAADPAFGGNPSDLQIQAYWGLLESAEYAVRFHRRATWHAVELATVVGCVGAGWSSAGVDVEKYLGGCRMVNCYSGHSGCSGKSP